MPDTADAEEHAEVKQQVSDGGDRSEGEQAQKPPEALVGSTAKQYSDLEVATREKMEDPKHQAHLDDIDESKGPVELPFESFLQDGSLPDRPRSFIEETYDMRYLADYSSPGDDMWVSP
jgi:hypothetical protein